MPVQTGIRRLSGGRRTERGIDTPECETTTNIQGGVGNLRFTESMIEAFRNVKGISRERQVIPSWWSEVSNIGAFTMPTLHRGKVHFTGKTEGA